MLRSPKKRDYRQRAHCNPLSDRFIPYPLNVDQIDWTEFYPVLKTDPSSVVDSTPSILDIGCGYGGMSFALSELFKDRLILAFEIRCVVTTFVQDKINFRRQSGLAQNVAVQWANTMRTLMRYIQPHSIERMFILFPDPHFKNRKAKWRIISPQLMDEYAFITKSGALFYLVTDVQTYFEYAVPIVGGHPLFERIPDAEIAEDPALKCALTVTEEAKKVEKNGGKKFWAVFRRI